MYKIDFNLIVKKLKNFLIFTNSLMNSDRKAISLNSYEHELGFSAVEYIVGVINDKARLVNSYYQETKA